MDLILIFEPKNLKYLNLENNNIEFLTDSDTNEPLLPITLIKLN